VTAKNRLERSAQGDRNEQTGLWPVCKRSDEKPPVASGIPPDQADALRQAARMKRRLRLVSCPSVKVGRYEWRCSPDIRFPRNPGSFKFPQGKPSRELHSPSRWNCLVEVTSCWWNVHFDLRCQRRTRTAFRSSRSHKTFLDQLTMPFILMGDFNDTPDSRTVKLPPPVVSKEKSRSRPLTYSANGIRELQIDYLFASPCIAMKVNDVRRDRRALASDHRPVAADFQLIRSLGSANFSSGFPEPTTVPAPLRAKSVRQKQSTNQPSDDSRFPGIHSLPNSKTLLRSIRAFSSISKPSA